MTKLHPQCNVVTGACCDECAMTADTETGYPTVVPTPSGISYNLRDEFPYNLTNEQRWQLFYPWDAPFYRFQHPRWRRVWMYGMWRYIPWWWMGGRWGAAPVMPITWSWMGQQPWIDQAYAQPYVQVGQGMADLQFSSLSLAPQNQQIATPVVSHPLTPISYEAFGVPRSYNPQPYPRVYNPQPKTPPPVQLCLRVMQCLMDLPSSLRAFATTVLEDGGFNSPTLAQLARILFSGGQVNAANCLNALVVNEFGQSWG